jgi:phage shock protein PspC (stress-responsive transcriptional regulator)
MSEQPHRLTRSETDRMLVGVCGGLGEHFGIDSTIVRVAFVVLALFGASGIVLYLALWLIVPRASQVDAAPREAFGDSIAEGRDLAQQGTQAAKRGYQRLRGGGPAQGDGPARPAGEQPGPPPGDVGRDDPDGGGTPPR